MGVGGRWLSTLERGRSGISSRRVQAICSGRLEPQRRFRYTTTLDFDHRRQHASEYVVLKALVRFAPWQDKGHGTDEDTCRCSTRARSGR